VEGPYVYDPYGDCFSGGSACSSSGEPYRFTGRRLDPETGLLYYRARYYWPQGGRFLQTDPVGYAADLNLYTYVGNDPTDKTDPSGNSICEASRIGAASDSMCGGTKDPNNPNAGAGSPFNQITHSVAPTVQIAAEHTKGQRPSTEEKHEKGEARKGQDRGGEKADKETRRPPRVRPDNWKGPWPPKQQKDQQKFEQQVGPCLVAGPGGCDSTYSPNVYIVPGPVAPGTPVPGMPGLPILPELLEPIPVP
jgi:RHS repeat-associated protein